MDNRTTENEFAQYLDALVSDKEDQPPEEILEHVEECLEYKFEVMEVVDVRSGGFLGSSITHRRRCVTIINGSLFLVITGLAFF